MTPEGIILPVSAVIVNDRRQYDAVLESFSKPVMDSLSGRYRLDDTEELLVIDPTLDLYRSFDATPMVLALGRWLKQAVEHDLLDEIAWLRRYDKTRELVRDLVDIPDRKLRMLLEIIEGNDGRLSANKRALFAELSDSEVARIEATVHQNLLSVSKQS